VNELIALGTSGNSPDESGQVFFYGKKAGQWVLKETLASPSATADGFGFSLAIWGNKLVVGAPYADDQYDVEGNFTYNSGPPMSTRSKAIAGC
jgi:hypothetical protein